MMYDVNPEAMSPDLKKTLDLTDAVRVLFADDTPIPHGVLYRLSQEANSPWDRLTESEKKYVEAYDRFLASMDMVTGDV